jgi:hypothetical protein
VSGVLFTCKVSVVNLGLATAALYVNPWATRPYKGVLTQLTTATVSPDGREYELRPGTPLREMLQIADGWPLLADRSVLILRQRNA